MKSVPSLLFFKPMKEEPPEWVQVFGWSIFTPDGHISGRGVDKGLPCEMAFKLPYRPGEKCLDKSTGKVVTILSCEPMRVEEVTEEDCKRLDLNGGCLTCGEMQPCGCDHPVPDFRDSFLYEWNERHPGKSWAWRVEGEGGDQMK